MSDYRYNLVNLILGRRGSGKTVYLKGDPNLNIPGLFPIYLNRDEKILIIDTFDHPSYRDVKTITPNNITNDWVKGVYRCFVHIDDIENLLDIVSENFSNGLIVFEDAHKHQYGKLSRSLMRLIGDSKQKNVDMIFMYHNWALVPKDLYRYLDYIEVFKTKDTPESRKNDMPGCYDEVMKQWRSVMQNPNPFYHLTVDCG